MSEQAERGTLEQISLALLMIRALDRRWSGTLVVEPKEGGRHLLEFQRGLVCRAIVPDDYARLGALLRDAKVITDAELEVALEVEGLLGEALQQQDLLDDKTLQRALVLQLLRRTVRMFGFPPSTTWEFTADVEAFSGMAEGVRIDTLRVLWAGISAFGEMSTWLALTLRRIGESPFQVRPDVNLRRYGFTGDARRVVRAIRDDRIPLRELVERGLAPEDVVKQIVYLLAITRYLDFSPVGGEVTAPPVSSTSDDPSTGDEPSISDETTSDEASVSEPPTSSDDQVTPKKPRRVARIKLRRVAVRPAAPDPPGSGEQREPASRSSSEAAVPSSDKAPIPQDTLPDTSAHEHLRAEINSRLARLERETPFSLLNLKAPELSGKSDDELTDVLWEAYERISKRWHPDNCPSELSELREGMAKIHDSMTEAFMTLTESDDRMEMIQAFTSSAASHSELPPTMRSESDVSPDSGESEEAPSSGERPIEVPQLSATELHAKALVALSEQRLDEALRTCRQACDQDPDNPDYLASSVWIRAGMAEPDTKVLLLDLDGVLRAHPDHIQARFYRGVLRRRLGSDNAAKRDFERVLELQENHAGAKAQLNAMSKKKQARK